MRSGLALAGHCRVAICFAVLRALGRRCAGVGFLNLASVLHFIEIFWSSSATADVDYPDFCFGLDDRKDDSVFAFEH
jgi:hypothetical protein